MRVTVRPSGTEPKIKMYFEVFGKPFKLENIDTEKEKVINIREDLEKSFMQYCYKLLMVPLELQWEYLVSNGYPN